MSTATVWALSALSLMTIIQLVYFIIFFMIFFVIAWAIAKFVRAIGSLIRA